LSDDVSATTERATEVAAPRAPAGRAAWYAVWTRSNFERLVADQLAAKGFSPFLPEMGARSLRSRTPRVVPMFPGYLFLHHTMEKGSYIEIVKARGVVRVLEGGWDRLTPIAEAEIERIQRVINLGIPVSQHPYFAQGDRVRVTGGPLTGLEGFFVRDKPSKGRLVLSIDLLRTSVAVEVESALVAPSEAA
jgi:transcription antitermination factor NusG